MGSRRDRCPLAHQEGHKNQGAHHMVSIPSRWCGQLQAKVRTLDAELTSLSRTPSARRGEKKAFLNCSVVNSWPIHIARIASIYSDQGELNAPILVENGPEMTKFSMFGHVFAHVQHAKKRNFNFQKGKEVLLPRNRDAVLPNFSRAIDCATFHRDWLRNDKDIDELSCFDTVSVRCNCRSRRNLLHRITLWVLEGTDDPWFLRS